MRNWIAQKNQGLKQLAYVWIFGGFQVPILTSKSAYSTGIISLDFLLRTSTDLAKGLHGTLLCNIGFMYRDAGDSLNAYKVHQQAITLTLKNSDPENLVYAYTKAGETYGHFKNLSKKMEFLKKKYDLYKSIKNDQKSGVQAGVIGKEYEEQRKNYQSNRQSILFVEYGSF